MFRAITDRRSRRLALYVYDQRYFQFVPILTGFMGAMNSYNDGWFYWLGTDGVGINSPEIPNWAKYFNVLQI